jgi:hypothetical protein
LCLCVCEYHSCLIHKTNQVSVFACPTTSCFPAHIPWEKISVNWWHSWGIYAFVHINKNPTGSREQRNPGNAVRGRWQGSIVVYRSPAVRQFHCGLPKQIDRIKIFVWMFSWIINIPLRFITHFLLNFNYIYFLKILQLVSFIIYNFKKTNT